MTTDLYVPRQRDFSVDAMRDWFGNIAKETASDQLPAGQRGAMHAYYAEAGLLRPWRRPFFWRHYAETLSAAARFLFANAPSPVILDLGCGTGTQSLLFALHGARVVAIDADADALRTLRSRKPVYEAAAQRPLAIEVLEGNTLEADYERHGPIDGVYSLFAFNIMQPSGALVDRLCPALAPGARFAVLDGNRDSVWAKALGRKRLAWSPSEMRAALEARGFRVESQRGGVALPPLLWGLLPGRMAHAVDTSLCGGMTWPISCQTLAVRDGVRAGGAR